MALKVVSFIKIIFFQFKSLSFQVFLKSLFTVNSYHRFRRTIPNHWAPVFQRIPPASLFIMQICSLLLLLFRKSADIRLSVCSLTLPVPSLLVPTPYTKGGSSRPPAISNTVAPMNLKFCRVLETPLKVLEMLKLFT